MKKTALILCILVSQALLSQEITLSHNIGNNIIDQNNNFTCSGGGVSWARVFVLENFDITGEYTINSGSFGIQEANTAPGEGITVNVYEIDEGFPSTFNVGSLLGSSELIDIPPSGNTIFSFDFPIPIVLPNSVEMILVEARLASQTQNVFIGGTMNSNEFSWWNPLNNQSCVGQSNTYQTTIDVNRPDLNYYITVTGENVLGVNDAIEELISIGPNPVGDRLIVRIPESIEVTRMMVYDISGKLMKNMMKTDEIDVSRFPSGLYFLKIMTPNKFISERFIKQ